MKQERGKILESIMRHREAVRDCIRKVNTDLRNAKSRQQPDDEEFFESARKIKSMLQG